jgi:ABC-type phosphate transport system ATPase subunit
MDKNDIVLVHRGSHIYNVQDKEGCGRGTVIRNGKYVYDKNCCLIYSAIGFDGDKVICESWNIMGIRYEEKIPIQNLEPFNGVKSVW